MKIEFLRAERLPTGAVRSAFTIDMAPGEWDAFSAEMARAEEAKNHGDSEGARTVARRALVGLVERGFDVKPTSPVVKPEQISDAEFSSTFGHLNRNFKK